MSGYSRTTWEEGVTSLSAQNMNNIEDGVEEALAKAEGNSDMWGYIRNLVYPVGSIYMSVNNTNPSTLFGGTWVAWGQGRVPVGVNTSDASFDTVEETGGSKNAVLVSHSHSFSKSITVNAHVHFVNLSTGEGGYHRHDMGDIWSDGSADFGSAAYVTQSPRKVKYRYTSYNGSHSHAIQGNTGSAGGQNITVSGDTSTNGSSATNANLQPYITCYMWKRTA